MFLKFHLSVILWVGFANGFSEVFNGVESITDFDEVALREDSNSINYFTVGLKDENEEAFDSQDDPKIVPWYMSGPNICRSVRGSIFNESEYEQDIFKGLNTSTSVYTCIDEEMVHVCTNITKDDGVVSQVVERIECCNGSLRRPDQMEPGCQKIELQPLYDTLNDSQSHIFKEMIDNVSFKQFLNESITLFVPINEALNSFFQKLQKIKWNKVEGNEQITYFNNDDLQNFDQAIQKKLIKSHILKRVLRTSDMKDNDVISTYLESSKLRINIHHTPNGKVVFANCAKVVAKDQFAINGIVHYINNVIVPVTKTIAGNLLHDDNFGIFSSMLDSAGIMDDLFNVDAHYTLFAPTNQAFQKLDKSILSVLFKGLACARKILNYHILNYVICSGTICSKPQIVDYQGSSITLQKDGNNTFYVNGIHIVTKDVMSLNGVIHVIEDVLIPDNIKNFTEVLREHSRFDVENLYRHADLLHVMNEAADVTIFIPSRLISMESNYFEDLKHPFVNSELKNTLLFHVVKHKIDEEELEDNTFLETKLENYTIRINTFLQKKLIGSENVGFTKIITAQCAVIKFSESETCGGSIKTIEGVLKPSAPSVFDILKSFHEYGMFMKLIKFAEMEDELECIISADNPEETVTIFAPTNESFEFLTPEFKDKLFGSKTLARSTVLNHIVRKMICCIGIPEYNIFFEADHVKTMANKDIFIGRVNGQYQIDRTIITTCDKMAENGVVHSIFEIIIDYANIDG